MSSLPWHEEFNLKSEIPSTAVTLMKEKFKQNFHQPFNLRGCWHNYSSSSHFAVARSTILTALFMKLTT